jgi:crossover junction endodeoxyribonuclease RuvC
MINRLLVINEQPKYFDATDAVAVACCHYFQRSPGETTKSYSGWGAFVSNNPGRVK